MQETREKILVVEDDREIATIEKDFLEINGFDVVIENNGPEGQKRALSGDFSLILLDLMLPGKDGVSVCREIRERSTYRYSWLPRRARTLTKYAALVSARTITS